MNTKQSKARYVLEFANAELNSCTEERKQKIKKIMEAYKKSLITPLEAVYQISKSYYDEL